MKVTYKIKDTYNLDIVSYFKIAKTMDFINEYAIKCFCGYIKGDADPHQIQGLLYKKDKKINSVIFQFAIDIMSRDNYIATIFDENDSESIKCFQYTQKGIEFYFKGGFMKEIIKRRKQRRVIFKETAFGIK